eukprot:3112009-Ditylum_brightwellii.AAC.1
MVVQGGEGSKSVQSYSIPTMTTSTMCMDFKCSTTPGIQGTKRMRYINKEMIEIFVFEFHNLGEIGEGAGMLVETFHNNDFLLVGVFAMQLDIHLCLALQYIHQVIHVV